MKIITADGCGYCDKAKDLMTAKGDSFEEFKLDSQSAIDLYRFMGHKTVPLIIGIGGYTELVKYYEELK